MRTAALPRWSAPAAVAAAAAIVYAPSLANGFAYDDVPIIVEDPRVHGLGRIISLLTKPYWAHYGRELGLYRPLTSLGYALQWTAGGGAPWVFHLVSLALNVAACVLLFLLLRRFAGQAGALAGALVFAVHPVHTEAVANVVGQAELLAAVGILAACVLWAGRPERGRPAAGTLAGVAGAYALAVFAKESAIVAPALLVALDLAGGRVELSRAGIAAYARRLALALAAFAAIALAYLAARYGAIGGLSGGDVAPSIPFLARDHFWMGLRAWPEYVRLLLFPMDLSSDYSPAVILPVRGWTAVTMMGAALLLATAAVAAAVAARPKLGLPAAWFLLSILVVSNLFFPIGVTLAERTLYLPSAALAFAVAFAWPVLGGRYPRWALAVLGLALLAAFGFRSWTRIPDWKDQEAVVSAMIRDHPESYRAQWFAAVRAFERGDTAEADRDWALAYRLWPGDSRLLAEYAGYEINRGNAAFAQALLDRSLAIHPDEDRALELYAMALLMRGRPGDALALTDRLLPRWGGAPGINDIRARAFMALGDFPRATDAWSRVVRAYPATWVQWSGYARSLAHTGDFAGAFAALDSARTRAGADSAAIRQIAGYAERTRVESAGRVPAGEPRATR